MYICAVPTQTTFRPECWIVVGIVDLDGPVLVFVLCSLEFVDYEAVFKSRFEVSCFISSELCGMPSIVSCCLRVFWNVISCLQMPCCPYTFDPQISTRGLAIERSEGRVLDLNVTGLGTMMWDKDDNVRCKYWQGAA